MQLNKNHEHEKKMKDDKTRNRRKKRYSESEKEKREKKEIIYYDRLPQELRSFRLFMSSSFSQLVLGKKPTYLYIYGAAHAKRYTTSASAKWRKPRSKS